jgi:xanthine dehydrogenase accessory factor
MTDEPDREGAAAGPGWLVSGLEDDIRPHMFAAADRGVPFALATIVAADGGPRPVGAQMVVTGTEAWGFLSGGCIEDDVALNARETIADGTARRLIYGEGSPFVDIRLPCGGRIEVAIERVDVGDEAVAELKRFTRERIPAVWASDGTERSCQPVEDAPADAPIRKTYDPVQRLVVIGSDPFALAIGGMGRTVGWEIRLLSPFGPSDPAPFDLASDRRALDEALDDIDLDRWTAVAVATHDLDLDERALIPALQSDVGYVGVLGSRRKLAERIERLAAAGLTRAQIDRLRAPIGLAIPARSPWEVAVSVVAEVIASRGD